MMNFEQRVVRMWRPVMLLWVFAGLGFLLSGSLMGATNTSEKVTVTLTIEEPIDKPVLYLTRRAVDSAKRREADAIVIIMDTPGGRLDIMREIIRELQGAPCEVITFVKGDALSAGAIIAMCTDRIYMAPLSRIGDAIPIQVGPTGLVTMDAAEREKITRELRTFSSDRSALKGHHPDIVGAMIDIGEELAFPEIPGASQTVTICETGKVLLVNNSEAERKFIIQGKRQSLISSGTKADLQDVLVAEGLNHAAVHKVQATPAHKFAGSITKLAPFLIIFAIILFKHELMSPGIGIFGVMGVLCIVLLFYGHQIAGLAGYEEMILFVIGLICIGLEVFVIPGFGIAGIAGIGLILVSLFMAMVRFLPAIPSSLPGATKGFSLANIANLDAAVINMMISLVGITAATALMATWLPKSKLVRSRLALDESTSEAAGYTGSHDQAVSGGEQGTASTDLRPSGSATIDGAIYDVFTMGEFIPAGTPIRVMSSRGNRIIVEAVES